MISCSSDTIYDEISAIIPNEESPADEVTPEEEAPSNQIITEKDLVRQNGEYPHLLNYDNGRVAKSWSYGHTYRSEMIYNSDGTLSGKYIEGNHLTNENFDWEVPENQPFLENIYENGKLKYINLVNSGVSCKQIEYVYKKDDLVIEKRYFGRGAQCSGELIGFYRYEYNDQNELVTIFEDFTASSPQRFSHTLQVTFDDKVNPYYKIWMETKTVFLSQEGGLARHNLEFYPHNMLSVKEGVDDIWMNAVYSYDKDNLPVTMDIIEGKDTHGGSYSFDYQ